LITVAPNVNGHIAPQQKPRNEVDIDGPSGTITPNVNRHVAPQQKPRNKVDIDSPSGTVTWLFHEYSFMVGQDSVEKGCFNVDVLNVSVQDSGNVE
jgi:hypothetical protein